MSNFSDNRDDENTYEENLAFVSTTPLKRFFSIEMLSTSYQPLLTH